MPKTKKSESVLHDWVHELPFQMQALLMTGVRGPDGSEKHNDAKIIVRYLRGCVLKPAGDWSGTNNNDFMWGEYDRKVKTQHQHESPVIRIDEIFQSYVKEFWNNHDHYPHHFIMHLIHCAEIVGTYYPILWIRNHWMSFYQEACDAFHMNPETKQQLERRLNDFGCGYKEEIIPREDNKIESQVYIHPNPIK